MTQATDTDIREIKSAIDSIARGTEANTKAIADLNTSVLGLREEMRVGFSEVRGDIKTINARLTNLESNTKTIADLAEKVGELKNWKQIAIVIFTATVGGAIGYFVRVGK